MTNSSGPIPLEPMDAHNRALLEAVHPADWTNPTPADRYHLVVIGGGTAGLVTAMGAAGLGARVALVERHLMGGDCLNTGCVPSKTLLAAAHAPGAARRAPASGVHREDPVEADFTAAMERVRSTRASISRHDSVQRFAEAGIDVFLGDACFTGSECVEVAGARLRYRKAVIATGARPAVPDIPGLAAAGCLTSETVWSLTERPARMAVIGGGPIGVELSQAFRRLGVQVTLLEKGPRLLPRDDADAARCILESLQADGLTCCLDTAIAQVRTTGSACTLTLETPAGARALEVDALLAATGRRPNVEGMGLEAVGVEWSAESGVRVDDALTTTNPRVYACGDVCSPWRFTHAADAMARIVIENALFGIKGKKKHTALTIPWCTYADPEVAQVGLTAAMADARGIAIDTFEIPMSSVDRAQCDGDTRGFLKVHTAKGRGTILGATLVGPHAGDMISELTLAMVHGIGLGSLARVIHPYPTRAEIIRKAADACNRTRLTPRTAALLKAAIRWLG